VHANATRKVMTMTMNDDMFKKLAKELEFQRRKWDWESGGIAKDLVSPNVIPTMYKGIQFRSRLEARWAVFFDTLGIEWEYETQGYEIGVSHEPEDGEMLYTYSDGSIGGKWDRPIREKAGLTVVLEKPATGKEYTEWYLPDFWLPELKIWAEVKGVFGDDELLTTVRAVDGFSMGLPNIHDYTYGDKNPTGLLYLGDIPNPEKNMGSGSHIIFTLHKGVQNRVSRFRFNHALERVELEVGDVYNSWLYLDVTVGSVDNMVAGPREKEDLYKRVVKGLPRDKIKRPFVGYRDSHWDYTQYPPIDFDIFGEAVIEAGWKAARNAQF
jgi:hypothetical protein